MLGVAQAAGGPSVFVAAQKWEGQVVADGSFHLRQYLGGSDHSAVFLTDIGVGQIRPAAIKLIATDRANAEIQLARWEMAAKLSHPNMLQIFEFGRCQLDGEELLFVVTENADETLSQILPQRALTPGEVSGMLKPALAALAYLHENGFAHGRVKPSNIVAVTEQLKLSSDSLCRIGTPLIAPPGAYDAPEAPLEGSTPAGDIWSLGITLAEALTQRVPVWTDKLQGETFIPEGMPEPFSETARHCLVRDPRKRWTIAEIGMRLGQTPMAEIGTPRKTPDSASVPPRQRQIKSKAEASQPRKGSNDWLYTISIVALLGGILLLAGLLSRRPTSQTRAGQPTARVEQEVTPAARQPLGPVENKDTRVPRTARKTSQAPVPMAADRIVHQELPQVPEKALSTIHGRVRVTVRMTVDGSGNVAQAELDSAGPSRYFANLAIEAARHWKFSEGRAGRVWLLQFLFENTGASVHARSLR